MAAAIAISEEYAPLSTIRKQRLPVRTERPEEFKGLKGRKGRKGL